MTGPEMPADLQVSNGDIDKVHQHLAEAEHTANTLVQFLDMHSEQPVYEAEKTYDQLLGKIRTKVGNLVKPASNLVNKLSDKANFALTTQLDDVGHEIKGMGISPPTQAGLVQFIMNKGGTTTYTVWMFVAVDAVGKPEVCFYYLPDGHQPEHTGDQQIATGMTQQDAQSYCDAANQANAPNSCASGSSVGSGNTYSVWDTGGP